MINKVVQGDLACGKGPVVSYAPSVQINLNKLLIKAAEQAQIPFQRQASSRWTGTDTDAFAYSNDGVVSALISLPLRYMHTTVEMVHKEDVDNVIRLIYESLLQVQVDQDFRNVK
jgi:putative aminopeptidase FrvX